MPGLPTSRQYQEFVATTVVAAGSAEPLGILTVDAIERGRLSQDDVVLIEVLAQLLAAGLVM
jgi:hypothetical protein